MSDYYEKRLKERVQRRVRPFQYLLLHIFLFIATMIMMGVGTEFNLVSETAILIVAISFVISLLGHIFWRANQFIWYRVEEEEARRLAHEEKPKRERLTLSEDGELVEYDDYLQDEYKKQTASNNR